MTDDFLQEESITDYLLLDLVRAHPQEVVVKQFNKVKEGGKIGADWLWWFVGGGVGYGMRVQAKRMSRKGLGYDGLDRNAGKTGIKQIDLLIQDAAAQNPPLYPMYCFYNHWDLSKFQPE